MDNSKLGTVFSGIVLLGAILIVQTAYAAVPVWNYSTTANNHESIEMVSAIAISEDGNYVTAAAHWIYLFNRNGTLLWIYIPENYHEIGGITDIAINSDGQYIAAGITSRNGSVYYFNREGVRLWNYTLGRVWNSGYSGIHVAMSDDGDIVAVGSQDSYVYCFNGDGTLLWKYPTYNNVWSIAMSSNGSYIAAGTSQGNIFYFSGNGTLLWQYQSGDYLSNVDISTDGRYIVAGLDDNKTVSCLDREGNIRWNYSVDGIPVYIAMNGDGGVVAAATEDTIYCIDNEGILLWEYTPEWDISSLKISPDGEHISALLYSNQICYFNRDGVLLWKFPEIPGLHASGGVSRNNQAISRDGHLTYVAASASPCRVIFICNLYFFNPDGQENNITASSVQETIPVNASPARETDPVSAFFYFLLDRFFG